jgi:ribosomal protein L40E
MEEHETDGTATEETTAKEEIAQCTKCDTGISVKAEKCPECGYEPGSSTFSKLVFWFITGPWAALLLFISLGAPIGLITGELTFGDFFGGIIAIGILGAIPFWHSYRYIQRRSMKPTD